MPQLNAEQKASLGSMLGAFIGDSLGSYVEFTRGVDAIDESIVDEAMSMPGGGIWKLQPGQITDDSELAMCQLRGLLAGEGKFDLFHICLYYREWIVGGFDIGGTTRNGLAPLADYPEPNPSASHEAARCGPGETSISNGSLMKITPLAVWA